MRLRDRIIDWFREVGYRMDLTSAAWWRIGLAVVITLAITGIILATALPSRGIVDNAINDFHNQVDVISQQARDAADDTQEAVQNITDLLTAQTAELNLCKAQLADAFARLAITESALADSHNPVSANLADIFPDYTLYVKSSEGGNFTANVHLICQPTVGNATNYTAALDGFYAGINFTVALYDFVPIVTFDGTAWGISGVWFNIGAFELTANTEKAIDITCVGLNLTPTFAYVEVHKI